MSGSPSPAPIHCPKCGYNLTGLAQNVCPECGTEFDPVELRRRLIEWDRSSYRYCVKCGYFVTGLTAAHCPECGTAILAASADRRRWIARLEVFAIALSPLVIAGSAMPLLAIAGSWLFPLDVHNHSILIALMGGGYTILYIVAVFYCSAALATRVARRFARRHPSNPPRRPSGFLATLVGVLLVCCYPIASAFLFSLGWRWVLVAWE